MVNKNLKIELNFIFVVRTLAAVSFCLLVACTADIKSVEPTLNPNPKEIYDITVTVEGAPGEFLSAEGEQDYLVEDEDCLPPASALSMSGSRPVAVYHGEKVRYLRTSPTTFVGRVVIDRYIPKDDYGLGLCKWGPGRTSATLKNGINEHYISMLPPPEAMAIKKGYRFDMFHLDRSLGETKIVSLDGDVVEQSNTKEFPSDTYYFITMSAKKASP